jgi:putative oxidoreductase
MNTLTNWFGATPQRASSWSLAEALRTDSSVAQALLRVTLGAVLLPHGAQHALGLLGGYGFRGTLQWMTDTLGIPAPVAALGIVVELIGPMALILGLGSRAAGLALALFMATAAWTHAANGFFMNWFGAQPAGVEGYEYHLLTIAMAATVAARGAGTLSFDRWLTDGKRGQQRDMTRRTIDADAIVNRASSLVHPQAHAIQPNVHLV